MNIYIFISYGHDDYTERTRLLYEQLSKNDDFVIWWDEGIKVSSEWTSEIENQLNNLIVNKPGSCLIYIITPHSANVDRDNFCIKEIAKALDGRVRIIPVKAVDVPVPLLVSNIQWMDFTNCQFDDNNNEFIRRIERLCQIIKGKDELIGDGKQAALHSWLEPCSFSFELSIHLKDYEPRTWLLDKVRNWVEQSDDHLLLILGGPGTGKTAFSLWLSYGELSQYVAAWHLCQYNDKRTCLQRNAVKSLAYYLSTRIAEYYNNLDIVKVERDLQNAEYDAATLFKSLILEPLSNVGRLDGHFVILIDALDEASQNGYNGLAEILARYATQIPEWIKFIVTSRNDPTVTTHLLDCSSVINMDDESSTQQGNQDVRRYVDRMMASESIDSNIADFVVAESGNNFLYAHLLYNTIHDDPQFALGNLPRGINSYYSVFLSRYFSNNQSNFCFRTHARPLLNLILTAYEPLEKDHILYERLHDTCDWCKSRAVFNDLVSCFGPLLKESSGCLVPFHKSLSDWFLDENMSTEFSVYRDDGLAEMACWGKELLKDSFSDLEDKMVIHFYRYLPQYMIEANDKGLVAFYTNLDFWKKRQEVLGVDILLRSMIEELKMCIPNVRNRIFVSEEFARIIDLFSAELFNKGFYINLRHLGFTILLRHGMDDQHRLIAVRYFYINELYDEIDKHIDIFGEPYKDPVVESMVLNELGQCYRKLGHMERSAEYYRNSIKEAISANAPKDEIIYSKLNLSRVLTALCREVEAREILMKAVDEFKSGIWKGHLQGTDKEFSSRQLERAVRYVVLETENFSISPNQAVCMEELKWADDLYSDPIRRDRYYPNHLISKILFNLRVGNIDGITKLIDECEQSISSKFDGIRLTYLKAILLAISGKKEEAYCMAKDQFALLKTLPYHMIERTEFAALLFCLSNEDHISSLSKELMSWYKHTIEVISNGLPLMA